MKHLRLFFSLIGLVSLTACGGGGAGTTSSNVTATGVQTPAQVSVVTAN